MISREEAIKNLQNINGFFITDLKWKESMNMAIEALSQPERPKGRWIWKINKIGNGCHCVCSECGRTENKQEPFCNCGADMRDGEE